jgi:hypothetical protein
LAVLLILIFVSVFVDPDLDGVPDTKGLKINLHHKRPLGVVRPHEHRPCDVRGRALDDTLDDARAGAAAAVRATAVSRRRSRGLDLLLTVAVVHQLLHGWRLGRHGDGGEPASIPIVKTPARRMTHTKNTEDTMSLVLYATMFYVVLYLHIKKIHAVVHGK